MHSFGYWVRRQRKALDLTQAQLAELVGCAVVTVKKIEREERRPSRDMAAHFATHLGISIDDRAAFIAAARGRLLDGKPDTAAIMSLGKRPNNHLGKVEQQALQPLIGRGVELDQLLAAWAIAENNHAHCVLVEGGAGIGKTRLIQELIARAKNMGTAHAYTKTYSIGGEMAYKPVSEWLQSEPISPTLDYLDTVWLTEIARIVPSLLSRFPKLARPEPLTESWQRARLYEALAQAFSCYQSPLLLLLDDMQWCDSETFDWLIFFIEYLQSKPVLIVGTVRPEEVNDVHPIQRLKTSLQRSERITSINLDALSRSDTFQLAQQSTTASLTDELQQEIYIATAGNPLFVVESAKSLDNIGWANKKGGNSEHRPLNTLPPKVHAVLTARIQQLSEVAQRIASMAAVAGRSFTFRTIHNALGDEEDVLIEGLEELWQRHILYENAPNVYDFTHDRIRDVVYAAISPVRRPKMHERFAMTLEAIYAQDLNPVSGQIAVHYEQAGNQEQATIYYENSAEFRRTLLAYHDAIDEFRNAIRLHALLPETEENIERHYWLLAHIRSCLIVTSGFRGRPTEVAMEQMHAISQKTDDTEIAIDVLRNLSAHHFHDDMDKAGMYLERALAIAMAVDDKEQIKGSCENLAHNYFHRGQLAKSVDHYQKALAMIEDRVGRKHREYAFTMNRYAEALWFSGYPEKAAKIVRTNLSANIHYERPHDDALYCEFALYVCQRIGDQDALLEIIARLSELCDKYDLPDYHVICEVYEGRYSPKRRSAKDRITRMANAIVEARETTNLYLVPLFMAFVAEIHMGENQYSTALAIIEDALALASQTGDVINNPELMCLAGDCSMELEPDGQRAEQWYQKAIEIARDQGARMPEIRSVTSLGHLWKRDGRHHEAYIAISEILGKFTEGFDTSYLIEAKKLQQELFKSYP